MNERIKELSKQSFEYTLDRLNSGLEFRDFQPVWSEKFAELIIRECVLSIYRSDISDKKQERLVEELAHKFGFGVEE